MKKALTSATVGAFCFVLDSCGMMNWGCCDIMLLKPQATYPMPELPIGGIIGQLAGLLLAELEFEEPKGLDTNFDEVVEYVRQHIKENERYLFVEELVLGRNTRFKFYSRIQGNPQAIPAPTLAASYKQTLEAYGFEFETWQNERHGYYIRVKTPWDSVGGRIYGKPALWHFHDTLFKGKVRFCGGGQSGNISFSDHS